VPKPTEGIGQTSDLRVDMRRDPEATIARIVTAYDTERDLGRAAEACGARRRTLERLMGEYPRLKEAIDSARNRHGVLP